MMGNFKIIAKALSTDHTKQIFGDAFLVTSCHDVFARSAMVMFSPFGIRWCHSAPSHQILGQKKKKVDLPFGVQKLGRSVGIFFFFF